MGRELFKYLGSGIILVLLQVLIFNNIYFGGYINPFIYIFLIMLLPVDIKGWMLLLAAFFLGLSIDMSSSSGGMHTAATVFMAFCRPAVIRMISVKSEFEPGTVPSVLNMGSAWIMTYSFFLIILHHSVLFFLEIFRFTEFWITLKRIVLSGAFTYIFVFIGFILIDQSIRKKR